MALINKLEAIGNAIRSKTGGTSDLTLTEMVTEIENIPTGQVLPTSNGFANDSWETIIQIADMGLAPEYYNIGDYKTINLTAVTDTTAQNKSLTAYTVNVYIVAFNKMNLNGGGLGKITFMAVPTSNMDFSNWILPVPYAYFSWAGAGTLQSWLDTTLKASFPQVVQSAMKLVDQKFYNNYVGEVVTGSHYISLPNCFNLGMDGISTFNNSMTNSVRSVGTEHTFDYFADYKRRSNSFIFVYGSSGQKFLLADTCDNWKFWKTEPDLKTATKVDSSTDFWLLPIFTIQEVENENSRRKQ